MPHCRLLRPILLAETTYPRLVVPPRRSYTSSSSIHRPRNTVRKSLQLARPLFVHNSHTLISTPIQKRNMSSPADHIPSKNPPKEPPIPRPSSRYDTSCSPMEHTTIVRANLQSILQCSPHLANEPNPPSPSRPLLFRLPFRARLPRRCTKRRT